MLQIAKKILTNGINYEHYNRTVFKSRYKHLHSHKPQAHPPLHSPTSHNNTNTGHTEKSPVTLGIKTMKKDHPKQYTVINVYKHRLLGIDYYSSIPCSFTL